MHMTCLLQRLLYMCCGVLRSYMSSSSSTHIGETHTTMCHLDLHLHHIMDTCKHATSSSVHGACCALLHQQYVCVCICMCMCVCACYHGMHSESLWTCICVCVHASCVCVIPHLLVVLVIPLHRVRRVDLASHTQHSTHTKQHNTAHVRS